MVTLPIWPSRGAQNRAIAYDRLQKFAEAVRDWDKVLELSPKEEQLKVRVGRAVMRGKAVRSAKTVAEVAELAKVPGWDAGQWYQFARVYAIASGKSADKKQEYADRALELLRQAVRDGFKDAARLKTDSDLDPLRDRQDFRELIAGLEKKLPGQPEKQP